MQLVVLALVFLGSVASFVGALQTMAVEGKVELPWGVQGGQPGGPGPTPVSGVRVTLNGEKFVALTRYDGSFVFPFVPSGIYLVDVLAISELFPQLKIQVNAEEELVKVVEYKYPGAIKRSSTYPLVFTAMTPVSYFQVKPPVNILGFVLQNPMMLLMGFSAVLLVFLPKLLNNLDPEAREEYEKAQAGADPSEMLKKMLGGFGQ